MADRILPYPNQLPQDYYTKNLPTITPTVTPPTQPPIIIEGLPPDPNASVNNGGIWYGAEPPLDPQNGWLWSDTNGHVFIYQDPGVWQQIGTNW
jgi:hypothetical protein